MESEELYSFDKYKGRNIGIFCEYFGDSNYKKYHADVYHNGACVFSLSDYNPEKLLENCKEEIDEEDDHGKVQYWL